MGHVDDAHHAEGDGEPDRGEQQHRAEREAVPSILHGGPDRQRALDRADRARGGLGHRGRLVAHAGEQRQRLLVAARLEGGDRFELLDLGGIRLEQQDAGAGVAERSLDGFVGFLGERTIDRLERGFVVRLEHGLRSLEPRSDVRRLQRQAADRSVDAAAQAVVETHCARAVGNAGDGFTGRRVDRLAVGAGDVNLLAIRIGHEAAVLERADDGKGQLVAAARDDADRFIRVGKIIVGEFGDRILERTGEGRQRERDQEQREQERTETGGQIGWHCERPRQNGGEGGGIAVFSDRAMERQIRIRSPNRGTCWSWC
ncbi:hypothetical protein ACVWW2_001733 [Bradyrhizobium sp. LM4.3]